MSNEIMQPELNNERNEDMKQINGATAVDNDNDAAFNTNVTNIGPSEETRLPEGGTTVTETRQIDTTIPDFNNKPQAPDGLRLPPRAPSLANEYPFYGIVGDLLRAVMPHVEPNEMAIAAPFITGFANLIGRGPHFVAGGTEHYLQFYAALVGTSADARKSTAIDIALTLLHRVDPSWAARCQEITLLSGEGLVACLHDRHQFDDRDGDKRLFLVDTGLESTLRSIRRSQNTLSPILSDLWDAGIASTRSIANPRETTDALVSLIGDFNVSPRLSKRMLEGQTCFDRRFIPFFVERSKSLPRCRRLPADVLGPIMPRLKKVVAFARTVGQMQRSKKAERLWAKLYARMLEKHPERPFLVEELKAHAPAHVMRMACVFALLDMQSTIKVQHLKAAMAMWEHVEASIDFIFTERKL